MDAFYGLSDEKQADYDVVKEALMRKYALKRKSSVNNSLARQWRLLRQHSSFMTRLDRMFSKWVESAKISKDYKGLSSLLIREGFYQRCHADLAACLREKNQTDVQEIARSTQNYLDAHGGSLESKMSSKKVESISSTSRSGNGQFQSSTKQTCSVCKKQGHTQT